MNRYYAVGRLVSNTRNGVEALKTEYAYNVRSWMKGITGTLFSQSLYYNDKRSSNTNEVRYNGNIAGMDWIADSKNRGYDFSYAVLSRLKGTNYLEGGARSDKFYTSYSYDRQGNVLTLSCRGNAGTTTYNIVNNLTMNYMGNQFIRVEDAGTNPSLPMSMDFKNGTSQEIEYSYDRNGNMVKDLNKGISSIEYNVLNLPQKVTFTGANNPLNEYVYSAAGKKLAVIHKSSTDKRTDYVGNMTYENSSLKRILVDGGYIENGIYHFFLQDHLGNNRIVAKADGTVVQTKHYYPYGMSFAESTQTSNQPYRYNGKEIDWENGMNLYDYEARQAEVATGRFTTIDPLAEKYYTISPYVYCANNPVKYVDPTGMLFGDYYSGYSGKFLFSDGIDDNKVYIQNTSVNGNELVLETTFIGMKKDIPDKTDIFNAFLEKNKESFSGLDKILKARESNILFGDIGKYKRKLETFRKLVTDGAPYDIKVAEGGAFSTKNEKAFKNGYAFYNSQLLRYDDFGNFNYGVAGKAFGLSEFILELGAGVNQLSKPNVPHSIFSYGDEDKDNYMIRQGFKYYNKHFKK